MSRAQWICRSIRARKRCKATSDSQLISEKQKQVARFLRWTAAIHGATLVYQSAKDEVHFEKIKSYVNSLLFKTTPPKAHNVDQSKPLFISAGADRLASIGAPANIRMLEDWQRELAAMFPATVSGQNVVQAGKLELFPEPLIDTIARKQIEV